MRSCLVHHQASSHLLTGFTYNLPTGSCIVCHSNRNSLYSLLACVICIVLRPRLCILQKMEVHVRREDDAKYYSNFDVRQRVHVQVDASEMMAFNRDEIDSSPLG